MKKFLNIFLSSILSGLFIVIGATAFLAILTSGNNQFSYKIIGSLFFGLGLFLIIHCKTWLYTGKVGNILDNKPNYLIDLLVCIVGNILSVVFFSYIISLTRLGDSFNQLATTIVETKQNDSWYSILLLSIFCGFMIYLAVKGHDLCPNPIGKIIICFISISIFILAGFEHVIANASYYTFAKIFNLKALLYFFLMAIGNLAGSVILDGIFKLLKIKKENDIESNE